MKSYFFTYPAGHFGFTPEILRVNLPLEQEIMMIFLEAEALTSAFATTTGASCCNFTFLSPTLRVKLMQENYRSKSKMSEWISQEIGSNSLAEYNLLPLNNFLNSEPCNKCGRCGYQNNDIGNQKVSIFHTGRCWIMLGI